MSEVRPIRVRPFKLHCSNFKYTCRDTFIDKEILLEHQKNKLKRRPMRLPDEETGVSSAVHAAFQHIPMCCTLCVTSACIQTFFNINLIKIYILDLAVRSVYPAII